MPVVTPVSTPVVASIVATLVLLVLQVPPEATSASEDVVPAHKVVVPVMVPADAPLETAIL